MVPAAVVLMSLEEARKRSIEPLGRIVMLGRCWS